MNIFSLLSLFGFITIFFLGIYVYLRDPKILLNRLFFLYCMSAAYGAFMEFNIIQADPYEKAVFWAENNALVWPLMLAFQLHFTLVFIEKAKTARRPVILILIYTPAVLLSVLGVFGDIELEDCDRVVDLFIPQEHVSKGIDLLFADVIPVDRPELLFHVVKSFNGSFDTQAFDYSYELLRCRNRPLHVEYIGHMCLYRK